MRTAPLLPSQLRVIGLLGQGVEEQEEKGRDGDDGSLHGSD